jgi:hypothetical protein
MSIDRAPRECTIDASTLFRDGITELEQVDSHHGTSDEESHVILKWRVKFGLPLISDREYLFKRSHANVNGTYIVQDTDHKSDQVRPKPISPHST